MKRVLEYLHLESTLVPERLALLDALELQLATTFPPSFKAWYAQEHQGRPVKWGYEFITVAAEDFPEWILHAEGKRFLCLWYDDHGGRGAFMPLDDSSDSCIYMADEDYDLYETGNRQIADLHLKNLSFEDFMICNLVEYLEAGRLWPALRYHLPPHSQLPRQDEWADRLEPVVVRNFESLFCGYGAGTVTILPQLIRLVTDAQDQTALTKHMQVRFLGHRPAEIEGTPAAPPERLERMSEMLGFSLEAGMQQQAVLDQLAGALQDHLSERVKFWYSRIHGGFPVPWHEPGYGLPVNDFDKKWAIESQPHWSNYALLLWRDLGETQAWKLSLFNSFFQPVELHDTDAEFHIISRAMTFEDFIISRIFNWIIQSPMWVINHESQAIAPEDVEALFAEEAARAERDGAVLATLTHRLGERYFSFSGHNEFFLLTAHSLRRIRRLPGEQERYLLETAEVFEGQ